jgi:hypothetical protein
MELILKTLQDPLKTCRGINRARESKTIRPLKRALLHLLMNLMQALQGLPKAVEGGRKAQAESLHLQP